MSRTNQGSNSGKHSAAKVATTVAASSLAHIFTVHCLYSQRPSSAGMWQQWFPVSNRSGQVNNRSFGIVPPIQFPSFTVTSRWGRSLYKLLDIYSIVFFNILICRIHHYIPKSFAVGSNYVFRISYFIFHHFPMYSAFYMLFLCICEIYTYIVSREYSAHSTHIPIFHSFSMLKSPLSTDFPGPDGPKNGALKTTKAVTDGTCDNFKRTLLGPEMCKVLWLCGGFRGQSYIKDIINIMHQIIPNMYLI